jgi:chlorite dismutase
VSETQTLTANSTSQAVGQQAVHFGFYKLRPSWWQLDASERARLGEDLLALIQRWDERLLLVSYSLVGLSANCDFMFWKAAESIDDLHELGLQIATSGIGPHLENVQSFLSLTKRSVYVRDHQHEGQEASRLRIAPVGAKYLFVYPFVKTRPWYVLPAERRQEMMNEHIRIGHKYPRVRINTTYSFGLDDQDFVLAFESDYPGDFLDLVMELRGSEASQYTERDTPMYTCIKVDGEALLATLGV